MVGRCRARRSRRFGSSIPNCWVGDTHSMRSVLVLRKVRVYLSARFFLEKPHNWVANSPVMGQYPVGQRRGCGTTAALTYIPGPRRWCWSGGNNAETWCSQEDLNANKASKQALIIKRVKNFNLRNGATSRKIVGLWLLGKAREFSSYT